MAPFNHLSKLTVSLFVACGALGVVVGHEVSDEANVALEITAENKPLASIAIPSFEVAGLETYSDVVQRPLFTESRRPPKPRPVAKMLPKPEPELLPTPVAVKPQTGGFRLAGVSIGENKTVALLKPVDGGQVWRLSEGDKVEGWTLQAIGADSVTLFRNGVEDTISLRDNVLSDADRGRLIRSANLRTSQRPTVAEIQNQKRQQALRIEKIKKAKGRIKESLEKKRAPS